MQEDNILNPTLFMSETMRDIKPATSNKVVYLKGLNGIRAVAVIAVICSHILDVFKLRTQIGSFGVTIFFTLSGFLITYLLLMEKAKTGTISIRNFYIRRVLRIWPLYFLYLVIAFLIAAFIFSQTVTFWQVFYYTFFLPNVPFVNNTSLPILEHYWSLGVEEQFYLIWPLLINIFSKKLFTFCLGFIALIFCLRLSVNIFYGTANSVYKFIYYLRFDCMAIGGLAAYFFYKKSKIIQVLHHVMLQVIAWVLLALILTNHYHFALIFDHIIVALVSVVLIINQVSNPKTIISLEKKPLNYIGKISYGLYVIHPLIIALLMHVYSNLSIALKSTVVYIDFPLETFAISLGLAHLSYQFIESGFLRKKQKYSSIQSIGSNPNLQIAPVKMSYKQ